MKTLVVDWIILCYLVNRTEVYVHVIDILDKDCA